MNDNFADLSRELQRSRQLLYPQSNDVVNDIANDGNCLVHAHNTNKLLKIKSIHNSSGVNSNHSSLDHNPSVYLQSFTRVMDQADDKSACETLTMQNNEKVKMGDFNTESFKLITSTGQVKKMYRQRRRKDDEISNIASKKGVFKKSNFDYSKSLDHVFGEELPLPPNTVFFENISFSKVSNFVSPLVFYEF